jgi:cytochrome c peroxidase
VGRNGSYWLPFVAGGTTFVIVGVLKLIKQHMNATEIKNEINAVKKEVSDAIQADLQKNNTHSIAPTLVRLAWHSAGTYSRHDKSGGSNGATMRFAPECEWKANAGLGVAREFLEPFKASHPALSYGDLWTLAGALAIQEMGGPAIPWRHGREDRTCPVPSVTEDRLPRADSGSPREDVSHIKAVFGRIGGLTHKETVALIGAHAVGRCHTEASGYWGPWTNAETTFSNEYFRLLLEETWTLKKTHNGKVSSPLSLSPPPSVAKPV